MAMSNLGTFFSTVEGQNLARQKMLQDEIRANSKDPIVQGLVDGVNIKNHFIANQDARADMEYARKLREQIMRGIPNQGGYGGNPYSGQVNTIPDSPYPVTQNTMGSNPLGVPNGQVFFQGLQYGEQKTPQGVVPFEEALGIDTTGVPKINTDMTGGIGANAQGMYGMPTSNAWGQAIQNTENAADNIYKQVYGLPQANQNVKIQNNQVMGNVTPEAKAAIPTQASTNQSPTMQRVAQNVLDKRNSLLNPNQPAVDNPQAQATGGVNTSPDVINMPNTLSQYLGTRQVQPQQSRDMSELYNIQKWMEADRAQGVTNPLVSMMRYNEFMKPMEEQSRQDELRRAFVTLQNADPKSKEYNEALALIQYYKQDPYMVENQQMKRAKFGWENEDRKWKLAGADLDLEGKRLRNSNLSFRLKAAQALGIDPSKAGLQIDEDGFIVGVNPFGSTKGKGKKTSPFGVNQRKQLLDTSAALGEIGKEIKDAEQKLKNPNLTDEEKKEISKKLDDKKSGAKARFKEAQGKYIEHLTPYLYTERFGGNGYDGLADLYLFMKMNDKSGLDSMDLSDSIARAARGLVTNGKASVNDIQKEILDRANMRMDIAQFDSRGNDDYGNFFLYEGVDPSNEQLNSIASPYERLGQVKRLRDQGETFARNDKKYGMYNNNLKGYENVYGYSPTDDPLAPQGNLEILGNKVGDQFIAPKGALPSINRTSVRDPIQRVRSGGWGASLKKKEAEVNNSQSDFGKALGYGNPFVNNMRELIGWYPFRWNDGTNCMRAISTALEGTPYGMSANGGKPLYNVDQAVAIARQLGQLRDPSTYTPRAGDIVVTNYSATTGHVGMVTENGGVIQNGGSGDEVELNITDKYGRRNGSVYETDTPVDQLHDDIAYYISTSDYLT